MGMCEVELQEAKWECMGNAWGEKLFPSSTHNKKLLLHLLFLCLAIHDILHKEDGVLIEQKLLGSHMAKEKGKSGLLTKAKQKS